MPVCNLSEVLVGELKMINVDDLNRVFEQYGPEISCLKNKRLTFDGNWLNLAEGMSLCKRKLIKL